MKTLQTLTITFMWLTLNVMPAIASSNSLADDLFTAADSSETEKNYGKAIEEYTHLIKSVKEKDPNNIKISRARARLARLYIEQLKFDNAEPLFAVLMRLDRNVMKEDPEFMIDLDDLSDAYLGLENDKKYGFASLKHALTLRQYIDPHHPHLPEIYRHLGNLYASSGDLKDAINSIENVVAIERTYSLQKRSALVFDLIILAGYNLQGKNYPAAKKAAIEGLATVKQCACAQKTVVTFKKVIQICETKH